MAFLSSVCPSLVFSLSGGTLMMFLSSVVPVCFCYCQETHFITFVPSVFPFAAVIIKKLLMRFFVIGRSFSPCCRYQGNLHAVFAIGHSFCVCHHRENVCACGLSEVHPSVISHLPMFFVFRRSGPHETRVPSVCVCLCVSVWHVWRPCPRGMVHIGGDYVS